MMVSTTEVNLGYPADRALQMTAATTVTMQVVVIAAMKHSTVIGGSRIQCKIPLLLAAKARTDNLRPGTLTRADQMSHVQSVYLDWEA